MKSIAVIPARYASTRFHAKLLQDLGGKPVILRTYENTLQTGLFDDVMVVTDSTEIADVISGAGGKTMMSRRHHESGSDRIAEAAADLDVDVIVNVQGDEPFMSYQPLADLLEVFKNDVAQSVDLASLMRPITSMEDILNPNCVKVVTDQNHFALYFSRSPIPHPREVDAGKWFQHIGVYAFRKNAIMEFATWPVSMLEATEKLEQLRYLERGKRIKMVQTDHVAVGIDTPEDLEKARKLL